MVLAGLERDGTARRTRSGRADRRPLPDRWSIGASDKTLRPDPAARRLRPRELDELVVNYLDTHTQDRPARATTAAKARGRSTGAVDNCLTRLADAGRVPQVSDKPRRYGSATTRSSKRGQARGSRKGTS